MRWIRRGLLVIAAPLGVGAVLLPAAAGSETPPKIEAVNRAGYYEHRWAPPTVTIAAGSSVTIANATTTAHGVRWEGEGLSNPAIPGCTSGVPVGTSPAQSGKEWSGTCTFTKPGTYTFYCTVHGPEMTAQVIVTGAGETTTTSTTGTSTGAPPSSTPTAPGSTVPGGEAAGTLGAGSAQVAAVKHRATVRGSVTVTGAGGRLEVDLYARASALRASAHAPALRRVGRLVRASVAPGLARFTVTLDRAGLRALRRHRRLALVVRITLTPVGGAPDTVSVPVTLRS